MFMNSSNPALLGFWLAIALIMPASASPPDKPLLPQATRIISLPPDNSTGATGIVGGVEQPWLSDHEVLHFKHGLLYRYNVMSITDTLLTQLTRQVKSSPCSLYFLEASPNGQQVIWGMSANNPLFVADINGARREQWDGDGAMTQPFWCADGKHWLQFHCRGTMTNQTMHLHWTKIQRHSLDRPQSSENFSSIPPGLNGLDIVAAPSADEIIARAPDKVKFETPTPSQGTKHADGTVSFTIEEKVTTRSAQTISVWSLHQPQPLHRYAVFLRDRVQEIAVSPDGKRVAWLLTSGPMTSASLWVSELDGSKMREVGAIGGDSRRRHPEQMRFPMQLHWVPGGTKVSFLYSGSLWVVAAD